MSSESLTYSLNGGDANGWLNPYAPPSMTSSQDSGRNDSNSDWLTSTARSSSSPPSSSPSKSSTLKAGSSNSIDHQGSIASIPHASPLSAYTSDPYICRSPNFYKSASQSSPYKKDASDKVKLISPLASPASSNSQRMDYKPSTNKVLPFSSPSYTSTSASSSSIMASFAGAAPKLDPPPKFRRTGRPVERWERGSWYGPPLAEAGGHFPSDSDYYSAYNSSTNNGGVVMRSHTRNNSSSSCSSNVAIAGAFRYSDSSTRSSLYSDNRDSTSSLSSHRHKLDLQVNDLNSVTHHQQQQLGQYQQQQPDGKWKMRLSYTSDENSDNSCDFASASSHSQGREMDRESLRS